MKHASKSPVGNHEFFVRIDEGFACNGLPRTTLSGGKLSLLDGELRAEGGTGKYVPRDPFPAVQVADATWRELNAPRRVERVDVTP